MTKISQASFWSSRRMDDPMNPAPPVTKTRSFIDCRTTRALGMLLVGVSGRIRRRIGSPEAIHTKWCGRARGEAERAVEIALHNFKIPCGDLCIDGRLIDVQLVVDAIASRQQR